MLQTLGRWRRRARRSIEAAIREGTASGLAGRALERHVRQTSYPFGARANWPYKVWKDEVRLQLGLTKLKPPAPRTKPAEGQGSLFFPDTPDPPSKRSPSGSPGPTGASSPRRSYPSASPPATSRHPPWRS